MADTPIRLVIIGVGKIVQDQHVPTLQKDPRFELVAGMSPHSKLADQPTFTSWEELDKSGIAFDAVTVSTATQYRYAYAREAIRRGKAVFLEKPPGMTVGEAEALRHAAEKGSVSLFASWHSRHAAGVGPAADWLKDRALSKVEIIWREDVRHWHPGQDWVWQAGGLGVFDPGINALSIATRILPDFFVHAAELTFPSNRDTPIAAKLQFTLADGGEMSADFDWRQTGPQTWDIRVEAQDGGKLVLSEGGSKLNLDGQEVQLPPEREYGGLYDRFAELVASHQSDVDLRPLQQVADALLVGARKETDAFNY
jgi:D-galactose 1-dehydrogenase